VFYFAYVNKEKLQGMRKNIRITIFILAPMLLLSCQIFAQKQVVVSGKVCDKYNEPIPGIEIQIKGSQSAVLSNMDGDYSLCIPDSIKSCTIVFNLMGYKKQEYLFGRDTNSLSKYSLTLLKDEKN
jgi:hypothetical protein